MPLTRCASGKDGSVEITDGDKTVTFSGAEMRAMVNERAYQTVFALRMGRQPTKPVSFHKAPNGNILSIVGVPPGRGALEEFDQENAR